MITKKILRIGFVKGAISIENSYGPCNDVCCRIGNHAFYFFDNEESLTAEELTSPYMFEKTLDLLTKLLKNEESAIAHGISVIADEYKYFEFVLAKVMYQNRKNITQSVVDRNMHRDLTYFEQNEEPTVEKEIVQMNQELDSYCSNVGCFNCSVSNCKDCVTISQTVEKYCKVMS